MKLQALTCSAALLFGCALPTKQYSHQELVQIGRQNSDVELCWISQVMMQYRDAALEVLQERQSQCDWDEVAKFHNVRMMALQQQKAESSARNAQFEQSMQLLGVGALILQNNQPTYQPQQRCTSRFMAGSWHTTCF